MEWLDCDLCGKPYEPRQRQSRFCGNPCNFELNRNEERNVARRKKEVLKHDNDYKHTTTQSGEVHVTNSNIIVDHSSI